MIIDRVDAAPPVNRIVAGKALDDIVVVVAGKRIVAMTATDALDTGERVGRDAIGIMFDAGAVNEVDLHVENIVVAAIMNFVAATPSVDGVVAAQRADDVVSVVPTQDIVMIGAGHALDADQDVGVAVGVGRRPCGEIDGNARSATFARIPDVVEIIAAIDRVITAATGQGVVARSSIEMVQASAAIELVRAIAAVDRIVAGITVENVVTGIAVENISAVAAVNLVIAVATVDRVAAITAVKHIVSGAAADRVGAVAGIEDIVAAVEKNGVVAGGIERNVVADHVGGIRDLPEVVAVIRPVERHEEVLDRSGIAIRLGDGGLQRVGHRQRGRDIALVNVVEREGNAGDRAAGQG